MRKNISLFRSHIALPQDHGAWVFILSPLLIGLFISGNFSPASFSLIIAATGAFLIRQPLAISVKSYSGRRSRSDLPAARFWIMFYGVIIILSMISLIADGFAYILLLAVPGIPVFIWHLYLVSRRAERRQPGVEIVAAGVLSLAAPAALWVGSGRYVTLGWWLWLLVWLQSAASIVYAYLRLEQRASSPQSPRAAKEKQAESSDRISDWIKGKRAFQYTSFNLALSFILGWTLLPNWIFIPYLLQWLETVWGITHPAAGWKPTAIGIRQLVVSSLFTLLFIIFWRL